MSKQALYTDGGTIGRNPSPHGGPWAFRHVEHKDGENDVVLYSESGILIPGQCAIEGKKITNNHTEFYALLRALESMERGWEGKVCSDSLITLGRFFVFWGNQKQLYPHKNIPQEWVRRRDYELARLGWNVKPVLLSGHPTREHLRTGIGARGTPVSIHNKWCDNRCKELSEEWKVQNGGRGRV